MDFGIEEMTCQDIERLFQMDEIARSSYFVLQSILGYSLTEIRVERSGTSSRPYHELAVKSGTGELAGAVRIGPEDPVSNLARLQIFFLPARDGENKGIPGECVRTVQEQLFLYMNTTRFFSSLFPWEHIERETLLKSGFEREATLPHHIYFNGTYHDLEMYGTERRRVHEPG